MRGAKLRGTEDNLARYAVEPLARWLITAAHERRSMAYGEAKRRLEQEHGFKTIFSAMMGKPAGALIERLQAVEPDVPLLNVLLVQQGDGLPGDGAAGFMAERFGYPNLRRANARNECREDWEEAFQEAAEEVYAYPDWERVYHAAFGKAFKSDPLAVARHQGKDGTEKDGLPRGRAGEGPNHKAFRLWVRDHPEALFGRLNVERSETEFDLLSGDRIDVVHFTSDKTIAIEVKSRDSNRLDHQRGVYQCVKYAAVLEAQDARPEPKIEAWLVTETEIHSDLEATAKRLGVRLKCIRRPD